MNSMRGVNHMYCMIARNQMKPGKVDAIPKALENDFVPIMKKIPGFRAAYMVAGPKGEYTAFVLWDSRANADAYANSPSRKTSLGATADLFEGPMKLEFGEVRYSATA
ncbi:antibiotic biosynthesis monooxygenase family protein [Chloroflexota bacterium]